MAKRKHHDKYASKKPTSDSIEIAYVCYMCGERSKERLVVISKFNRDISFFVCSNECMYSYRGE